jgi:hypothetical protein
MSTLAVNAASVTIKGQSYGVEEIPPGEDGTRAFVLTKANGTSYAVIRTHAGLVECDCPDYEARHRGLDCLTCKHGKALVEAGLLDAPRPAMPTATSGPPGSMARRPARRSRRPARMFRASRRPEPGTVLRRLGAGSLRGLRRLRADHSGPGRDAPRARRVRGP